MKKAAGAMHLKTAAQLKGKLEREKAAARRKTQQLIESNRGNLFAVYVLTSGMEKMDLQTLKACYSHLNEAERVLEPGRRVQELIRALEGVNVGAVAPDFTLNSPEGQEITMYSVKGKVKIIDFWASWCGPCRLENPNMVSLYNDFKDRGLTIISVSLDQKKAAWLRAIKKDGLPWIHLSDLKGWDSEVVRQYGIDAVPYMFVLDVNNRILAKQLRGEKLRNLVGELLK